MCKGSFSVHTRSVDEMGRYREKENVLERHVGDAGSQNDFFLTSTISQKLNRWIGEDPSLCSRADLLQHFLSAWKESSSQGRHMIRC